MQCILICYPKMAHHWIEILVHLISIKIIYQRYQKLISLAGQSCSTTAVPAYTIPNNNCQVVNIILSGSSGHSNNQPNFKLSNQVCCALANFQSIETKSHQIKDYIIDHDIDIFFITETWVHGNLRDALILSAATPPGFAYLSFPRLNRRGGGIAVSTKSV